MRWKATLVLLILTLAAGTYVSMVELRKPTRDEQQEELRRIVNIQPDEVTGLTVTGSSGNVSLQLIDGSWRLISPGMMVRADDELIRRILGEFAPLQSMRTLHSTPEKPLDLATFGLKPAVLTVTVLADAKTATLQFGEATAIGSHRYLRQEGEDDVHVVYGRVYEQLTKPRDTFRSHQLLTFDPWKAQRITVDWPGLSYTLGKPERAPDAPQEPAAANWQLISPRWDRADDDAVTALLNQLRGLRFEQVVTDAPEVEQLATWGFDQPYARILLDLEGSERPLELFIGKLVPDQAGALYAKRVDEPSIVTVNKAAVDEFLQDPKEYRSKQVFTTPSGSIRKVAVNWQERGWTIEQRESGWVVEADQSPADQAKVDEALDRIGQLRLYRVIDDAMPGVSIPAEYGLEPPAGTIRVWAQGSEDPEQLLVGGPAGQGSSRFGLISGRSAIVELAPIVNDLLATTAENFKPQPPTEPAATAPTDAASATPPASPSTAPAMSAPAPSSTESSSTDSPAGSPPVSVPPNSL